MNPEDALQLLKSDPRLCYALLQAMLKMNLIDPALADVICRSLQSAG